MPNLTIHDWPGPFTSVSSGAKKIPADAKFNRPWQARIPIDPPTCLLEIREQTELERYYEDAPLEDGWRLTKSTVDTEPYHNLIIPQTCRTWPEERTRSLGGIGKIAEAIEIAERRIRNDKLTHVQFGVQIGPLAAQNVAHLHYHLYLPGDLTHEPNLAEQIAGEHAGHLKDLLIFENSSFMMIAGGYRTGQCFFIPRELSRPPQFNADLAMTLNHVVTLYAERFRSVQGLPPDYRFELSIRNGKVQFGIFVPILDQTGMLGDMAMLTPCLRRWNLSWAHEETARYLRI